MPFVMEEDNATQIHEEAHDIEQPQKLQSQLPLLGIGLAALFAAAAFFSGLQIGSNNNLNANLISIFSSPSAKTDQSVDLGEFWQVWNILDQKFVSSATSSTPVTKEERIQGAIKGLVDSYGDPYTVFLPPKDSSMFKQDISGNFSGVGMEVGIRDNAITVIAPLPDTPAAKAGLVAGDIIEKVDDVSTDGMNVDEVVQRIRGKKGTTVKLMVLHKGEDTPVDISVMRDTINIPTTKTEVRGDVFVISLYSFNAVAESEMQTALRAFVQSGKHKLILDLRGNPGGFLQGAVGIASFFLPTGDVVVEESYADGKKPDMYRSSGKQLGPYAPEKMVVLVDGGSASAAEILAGALQAHGAATIIGSQTFGKGSVQELIGLKDNSSLKVTIARWLTPDGVSFNSVGLTPDIKVERTLDDRANGVDPQMDAAIQFLDK
jgi:carboxyl-terminal processing protease